MASPTISLRPHLMGRAVVLISSSSIVTALLINRFNPTRFRIHPYPYLSDAGLHDPERIIITFGLALSSALFAPFATALYLSQESYLALLRADGNRTLSLSLALRTGKCPRPLRYFLCTTVSCDIVPRLGLCAGFALAFSLALFTAIPGWFFFHHIFALLFAVSGATWCVCHAVFTHARCQTEATGFTYRLRCMYIIFGIVATIVLLFGVIWGSVKLQIPFKMIPNKDPRFVMLAFLEYVGTCSFLTFIAMVSNGLTMERINLSLITAHRHKIERKSAAVDV